MHGARAYYNEWDAYAADWLENLIAAGHLPPGDVDRRSISDVILCRDGKWRPVEPGTQPLAHGLSARVGRLRAYGNAIVPQVAAELVAAYLDVADC